MEVLVTGTNGGGLIITKAYAAIRFPTGLGISNVNISDWKQNLDHFEPMVGDATSSDDLKGELHIARLTDETVRFLFQTKGGQEHYFLVQYDKLTPYLL